MPKSCSVPKCRTKPDDRKSFYKFPLHDPERLHLWLRNMGKNAWTPTRHHYICHKHFTPSNFTVCRGVRYLKKTAVPTLFKKTKLLGESDRSSKWRWTNIDQIMKTEPTFDQVESGLESNYSSLRPIHEFGDQESTETNVLALQDQLIPVHITDNLSLVGASKEMVLKFENQDYVHSLTTSGITDVHQEEMENITCTIVDLANLYEVDQTAGVAYFETVPNLITNLTPHLTFVPETVLLSALSPQPITSTVPIVSKYIQGSKVSKSPEEEEEEEEEEEDDISVESFNFEQQQVEHCYHKNSVSKEQLEATVVELQKKVKIMQQHHHRHLEKLEGLEKAVGQLRQSKLLYEERLQCLERAYLQANATITDPEQIVTVIYEDSEHFYTNVPRERF
ncbi:unnamed protein product [Knipowitschia caucasica]